MLDVCADENEWKESIRQFVDRKQEKKLEETGRLDDFSQRTDH